MALVEYWRTDFDSDAKVAKFFYSPDPGGLANVAPLRRITTPDDSVSCIEIHIGDEVPDASYFRTFSGSNQDAYDKAVADLANRSPGDVVYIYSTDSTKHGRYVITEGGLLGSRTGSVTPKMANDENHRGVAQIRLLLQSWSAAGDPYSGSALWGYPDFEALHTSLGHAEMGNDLSGWTMRWTMRAIDLEIPDKKTKIVQHFQTRIESMPRVGSYSGAGEPHGSVAYVNAINRATCISDELGFGGDGLNAPNTKTYVADSGWVDVDIPLEALWSYWLMLGGNTDKDGHEGASYAGALRYVVANPEIWVRNWLSNAYMCEVQLNPNPDEDLPVIPEASSTRGRILVSSLAFLHENIGGGVGGG